MSWKEVKNPRYMLTMYKQITIQTLHKQGMPSARIAREIGCHRNTVANVLERDTVIEKQTRVKPSGFEPYEVQIKEWLDKKTSRRRMHDILHDTYCVQERYDTLCKYIQKHFPKPVAAFGVQIVEPGEVAEIDFGYLGMFPGPLGGLVKTYGFAAVLGYSRVGYFGLCYDQKLETLIENTYYSVPCHFVAKEVTVRWNEHLVRIICEGEQVAVHHKSRETGNYVTERSHLPDYKVYSHTEYQARFEAKFVDMGTDAHAYFRMLLEQKESYWFRIARSILGLREHYGAEAVNASLKRALYYGVRDVITIKNILERKLYAKETEPKLLDGVTTDSLFTRELTYYATGI